MSEKEEAGIEKSTEPSESGGKTEDLGKPSESGKSTPSAAGPIYVDTADTLVKRRPRLASSLAALQYISSISRDNYVHLRVSDRLTSVTLLLASILAVLSLVFHPLAKIRLPLAILCDVLVGIMILLYLTNRLGILIILSPREALLTWQLIVVSCVFGIFLAVNIGLFVAILVLSPTLFTSF
jgi:hypothetical protein